MEIVTSLLPKHIQEWQKTDFPKVFLLLGDLYLRQEVSDQLIDALLPGSARKNNLKIANLKEESLGEALSPLFTYSLTGERQVVRLSVENKRKKKSDDKSVENDTKDDNELIDLPVLLETSFVPNAYLIISLESVERKSSLEKQINTLGVVVRCALEGVSYGAQADKDAAKAAIQYIIQLASQKGKRLLPLSAKSLFDLCGLNVATLSHAISRLVDYVGDREEITTEDVKLLQQKTAIDPIYKFTEALFKRDYSKSIEIVQGLLASGEISHPLAFIASIVSRVRTLLLFRSLLDRFPHLISFLSQYRLFEREVLSVLQKEDVILLETIQEWEKELGVKKPKKSDTSCLYIKKSKTSLYPIYLGCVTVQSFSMAELGQFLSHLADMDTEIKTGADPMDQLLQFIAVVCQVCGMKLKKRTYAWDF